MAISNTLVISQGSGTATLTLSGPSSFITVTYTQSTNQITFSAQSGYVVSGADKMVMINQYNNFNEAIISNFHPSTSPLSWTQISFSENYSSFANLWSFTYSKNGTMVHQASASLGTGNVTISAATQQTLNWCEWMMFVTTFNHYGQSISAYLGL